MQKQKGFTLIELVIVIILTGILAATAIPKLIGNDGFEAQAYRDQLLQLLKTVQQQAMSCDEDCRKNVGGTPRTNNLYACNKVIIESNRFGIPESCGTDFPPTGYAVPHLGMSLDEANSSRLTFSSVDTPTLSIAITDIEFDSLGIAITCPNGCTISVEGAQSLLIIIESQGYVHEG